MEKKPKKRLTPKGTIILTDTQTDNVLEVPINNSMQEKEEKMTINNRMVKKERVIDGVSMTKRVPHKPSEEHMLEADIPTILHNEPNMDLQDYILDEEALEEILPVSEELQVELIEEIPTIEDVVKTHLAPLKIIEETYNTALDIPFAENVEETPVAILNSEEVIIDTQCDETSKKDKEPEYVPTKEEESLYAVTARVGFAEESEEIELLTEDALTEYQFMVEQGRESKGTLKDLMKGYVAKLELQLVQEPIKETPVGYTVDRQVADMRKIVEEYNSKVVTPSFSADERDIYDIIPLLEGYKDKLYNAELTNILAERRTTDITTKVTSYIGEKQPIYVVDTEGRTVYALEKTVTAYKERTQSSVTIPVETYTHSRRVHPMRGKLASYIEALQQVTTADKVEEIIQEVNEEIEEIKESLQDNLVRGRLIHDIQASMKGYKTTVTPQENQPQKEEEKGETVSEEKPLDFFHNIMTEDDSEFNETVLENETQISKTGDSVIKEVEHTNKTEEEKETHISKEETNTEHTSKTEEEISKTEEENGVVFDKGMSVLEFLKANPAIRRVDDVIRYFTPQEIASAVKYGHVFNKRGKLII